MLGYARSQSARVWRLEQAWGVLTASQQATPLSPLEHVPESAAQHRCLPRRRSRLVKSAPQTTIMNPTTVSHGADPEKLRGWVDACL